MRLGVLAYAIGVAVQATSGLFMGDLTEVDVIIAGGKSELSIVRPKDMYPEKSR